MRMLEIKTEKKIYEKEPSETPRRALGFLHDCTVFNMAIDSWNYGNEVSLSYERVLHEHQAKRLCEIYEIDLAMAPLDGARKLSLANVLRTEKLHYWEQEDRMFFSSVLDIDKHEIFPKTWCKTKTC